MLQVKKSLPVSSWIFIHFLAILFSILLFFRPDLYTSLTREDQVVENLTALFLFSAGVAILLSQGNSTTKSQRFLLIAGGILFLVAGAEEISWGQRIFHWSTPEEIAEMNRQHETNFHNMDTMFFDRLPIRFTILLVFAATFLYWRKKNFLFGIPVPPPAIILCFCVCSFYDQYVNRKPDFFLLEFICMLFIIFWSFRQKDFLITWFAVITLLFTVALPVYHIAMSSHFAKDNNRAQEVQEFIFASVCMCYAFCIHAGMKKAKTQYEVVSQN